MGDVARTEAQHAHKGCAVRDFPPWESPVHVICGRTCVLCAARRYLRRQPIPGGDGGRDGHGDAAHLLRPAAPARIVPAYLHVGQRRSCSHGIDVLPETGDILHCRDRRSRRPPRPPVRRCVHTKGRGRRAYPIVGVDLKQGHARLLPDDLGVRGLGAHRVRRVAPRGPPRDRDQPQVGSVAECRVPTAQVVDDHAFLSGGSRCGV